MISLRTLSVLLQPCSTVSLAVLGIAGMLLGGGGGTHSALASLPDRATASSSLVERLAVREISVAQRREARELLHAFTLGQMTRHYWGGFASSLVDLGLEVPAALDAELAQNSVSTSLSLQSRLGDEAYIAGVTRGGGRLSTWTCIGAGDPAAGMDVMGCPDGWQSFRTAPD